MRIAGTAQLLAPPEVVYDSLQDAAFSRPPFPVCSRSSRSATTTTSCPSRRGSPRSRHLRRRSSSVPAEQARLVRHDRLGLRGAGDGQGRRDSTARRARRRHCPDLRCRRRRGRNGRRCGSANDHRRRKKMAGVFFNGIDGVIANGIPEPTGEVVPVASSAASESATAVIAPTGVAPAPAAATSQYSYQGASVATVLASAAVGAGIALAGVVLGGILARR